MSQSRGQALLMYWAYVRRLPPEQQQNAMLELLHQICIEIANLESKNES